MLNVTAGSADGGVSPKALYKLTRHNHGAYRKDDAIHDKAALGPPCPGFIIADIGFDSQKYASGKHQCLQQYSYHTDNLSVHSKGLQKR